MKKRLISAISILIAIIFIAIVLSLTIFYFQPKTTEYIEEKWSVGYSRIEITPDDISEKDYYLSNYLSIPPKKVEEVLDGMFLRCISINDGNSAKNSVFVSIDCIGIASKDIEDIKIFLKGQSYLKNISSINIFSTNSHHTIDTFGFFGDILNYNSGKDNIFMDTIKQKIKTCIKNAVDAMQEGNLYFSQISADSLLQDTREPYVFDSNISRIRFVPEKENAKEIYLVNMNAKLDNMGKESASLTSDFPFYTEQKLNENDVDFMFINGAAGGNIVCNMDNIDGENSYEKLQNYGITIADKLLSIKNSDEIFISRKIKFENKKIIVPIENLMFETALENGIIAYDELPATEENYKYNYQSEVGFVQLGENIKIAIIPGQIFPELIRGGYLNEENSYTGENCDIETFCSMNNDNDICLTFGNANDFIGYIIPPNDFYADNDIIIDSNHYEETMSTSKKTAMIVMQGLSSLIKS